MHLFLFLIRFFFKLILLLSLVSCAYIQKQFPKSGPTREQIELIDSPIPVLNLDDRLSRKLYKSLRRDNFFDFVTVNSNWTNKAGPGDSIEITVWEAPPALLFGGSSLDAKGQLNSSRSVTFPEQIIGTDGFVQVPFIGLVQISEKPLRIVENEIVNRLSGKANLPQVLLRVSRNVTLNATVVGEVKQSIRLPLTAKGERILDALAASGGVTQAVGKISLQLSRNGSSKLLPMQILIEEPNQNILLQPGDVLTALYHSQSFTVLGATVKNEEISFEAQGISLAQALGRAGGLQDQRSDAQGVFVFRFEDPSLVEFSDTKPLLVTQDGKAPIVYKLDLKDPRSFLVSQNFPLRNKDVIYVSNAPSAELQKFLNILTSSIFSISNLVNITK